MSTHLHVAVVMVVPMVGDVTDVDISDLVVGGKHFSGPGVRVRGTIVSYDDVRRTMVVELPIADRSRITVRIDRAHESNAKPDVDLVAEAD
jgi:hypothetical protein